MEEARVKAARSEGFGRWGFPCRVGWRRPVLALLVPGMHRELVTVSWAMVVKSPVHCQVVGAGLGLREVSGCGLGGWVGLGRVCVCQVVIASRSPLRARAG